MDQGLITNYICCYLLGVDSSILHIKKNKEHGLRVIKTKENVIILRTQNENDMKEKEEQKMRMREKKREGGGGCGLRLHQVVLFNFKFQKVFF